MRPCLFLFRGLFPVFAAFWANVALAAVPHDIGGITFWIDATDHTGAESTDSTTVGSGISTVSSTTMFNQGARINSKGGSIAMDPYYGGYPWYSASFSLFYQGLLFDGLDDRYLGSVNNPGLGFGQNGDFTISAFLTPNTSGKESYFFWIGEDIETPTAPSVRMTLNYENGNSVLTGGYGSWLSEPVHSVPTSSSDPSSVMMTKRYYGYNNVFIGFSLNNQLFHGKAIDNGYTFSPDPLDRFYIGGGYAAPNYGNLAQNGKFTGHKGALYEMIIFNHSINIAQQLLLNTYYANKHYYWQYNTTSESNLRYYYKNNTYRRHVGGIGQIQNQWQTTGTSAALKMQMVDPTNPQSLWGDSEFLIAGVSSRYLQLQGPIGGTANSFIPFDHRYRSSRVWYIQKSGGGATKKVKFTFNLPYMNISLAQGKKVTLLYSDAEPSSTQSYSRLAISYVNTDGTVDFTLTDPKTGYYSFGLPGPVVDLKYSEVKPVDASVTFPRNIPGTLVKQTITGSSQGIVSPDSDTVAIDLPIPANMKFHLGDIGAAGSGPVTFADGTISSGLGFTYTALDSMTDNLEFSKDNGATWDYVPVVGTDKTDPLINRVRITLPGTLAFGASPNFPTFAITYGMVVQ